MLCPVTFCDHEYVSVSLLLGYTGSVYPFSLGRLYDHPPQSSGSLLAWLLSAETQDLAHIFHGVLPASPGPANYATQYLSAYPRPVQLYLLPYSLT